jgi:hypothetical protein
MRRFLVLVALVLTAVAPFGSAAHADELPVSIAVVGGRTLTSVALPALVSGAPSVLTSVVTETVAPGANPWSVTAQLCKPNAATPTQADCAASALVSTLDATKTISGSNMVISGRAVTPVGGGGTSAATAGSQDMTAARTIFANTGQNPALNYTGVYTSTANVTLTVPGATPGGTYNGFVVVTLVG